MTTAVIISSPKPNHHDVEVVVEGMAADGTVTPLSTRRLTDGESTVAYVHDHARLVVREVKKA